MVRTTNPQTRPSALTRLLFATKKAQTLIESTERLQDADWFDEATSNGWSAEELEALEAVETALCNIIADAETAKINVQEDIAECLAASDP